MPGINLNFLTRALTPTQTALLTVWVLLMISFPFVDWMLGWDAMLTAIVLGSLAQLTAVLIILWGTWGWVKTLRAAVAILLLGWAAEALGAYTGVPFGSYNYTALLQPQILGVPVHIPLGWLMMLPPSWAVAHAILNRIKPRWGGLAFIVLSALAMTAWDLMMDPMMVNWGIWIWGTPSGYFGVPWSNYLGWLLVAGLITAIIRPKNLPVPPLLLIYTITWLLEMGGLALFWGLPGPALVGGLAMGALPVLGWRALIK